MERRCRGILDSLDLALDAALSEAARNEHPVNSAAGGTGTGLLDVLGVDMNEGYAAVIGDSAVHQGLV